VAALSRSESSPRVPRSVAALAVSHLVGHRKQDGMHAGGHREWGDRKAGWRVSAIGHATAHLTNKLGTGRVGINR